MVLTGTVLRAVDWINLA